FLRKQQQRRASDERSERNAAPASKGLAGAPRQTGTADAASNDGSDVCSDVVSDGLSTKVGDGEVARRRSSRFADMSAWQLRRRLVEVENEIEALEVEMERITEGLAAPTKVAPALLKDFDTLPGRPPTDVEIVTTLGTRHA